MPKLLLKESDLKKYIKKIISEEMNGLLEGKKSFKDPNKFDPQGNPIGKGGQARSSDRKAYDMEKARQSMPAAAKKHIKSFLSNEHIHDAFANAGFNFKTMGMKGDRGGDLEHTRAWFIDHVQNSNIHPKSKAELISRFAKARNVVQMFGAAQNAKMKFEKPEEAVSAVHNVDYVNPRRK